MEDNRAIHKKKGSKTKQRTLANNCVHTFKIQTRLETKCIQQTMFMWAQGIDQSWLKGKETPEDHLHDEV